MCVHAPSPVRDGYLITDTFQSAHIIRRLHSDGLSTANVVLDGYLMEVAHHFISSPLLTRTCFPAVSKDFQ
jgi:hypothetical protein